MPQIEYKATEPFELLELSTEHKTAVIAHCAYDNIDKKKDIARKGMFNKSWKEYKTIAFLIDHNKSLQPGIVTNTYEDEKKAYTKVKLSNTTLGNDTLIEMDDGIIRGASFGFYTLKANKLKVKGQDCRELKEVLHDETTVAKSLVPINDLAGVVRVTKAELEFKTLSDSEKRTLMAIASNDQATLESLIQLSGSIGVTDDLYSWISWNISRRADMMGDIRSQLRYNASQIGELKAYCIKLENFCRHTKASDDCISSVMNDVAEIKAIISQYDTADTQLITEPFASRTDNDSLRSKLLLLNMQFQNASTA